MIRYSIDQISNFSSGCFNGSTSLSPGLDFLSTYIVQCVRCFVLVCIMVASLALYSSVQVMGKTMFNIGTCSVLWAVCFGIAALKPVEIILLLSFQKYVYVRAGFVIITVTQCSVVMVLLMALNHEWTYRSPAVNSKHERKSLCINSTQWKCNVFRNALYMAAGLVAPSVLLAIIETTNVSTTSLALFLASLMLPRLLVVIISLLVVCGKGDLRPTVSAQIFLVCGVLCSLAEEIPYFLLTTSNLCLRYASVYDVLQLLGVVSMVLLLLFVRGQYLRVEEECKLAMVWSVQSQMTISRKISGTNTYHTF